MSELIPEVLGPALPIPNLKSSKQPCLEGLVPAIVRMGKLALETGDLPVDGVATLLVHPRACLVGKTYRLHDLRQVLPLLQASVS